MSLLRKIANLGYGSRREVLALFADGRVTDADGEPLYGDDRVPHETVRIDGEPLVRRNALWLMRAAGKLEGLKELVVTTNGSQLDHYAAEMAQAGVKRVNISLDTLRADRFKKITRVGDIAKVLRGIDAAIAAESVQKKVINVDDQQFYDMLSAFCKSLRGGDSDAAIAWFARLIYAGVDPRIICRRLIAHASEDIGLANPQAMVQAVAAAQALEFIGLPEARLSIIQAIIFLCESPKSNSVVMALGAAFKDAEQIPDQPVPIHLRDTAFYGADKLGHGKGYKYPHDYPGHVVAQEYMPPSVKGRKYYVPGELGNEAKILQNHIASGKLEPSE